MESITQIPVSGPHTHTQHTIGFIMRQVIYALIPITALSFFLFGWPAFNLWLVSIITAIIAEWLSLKAFHKSWKDLKDNSAILTGWLIALTLPPWAPWWIAVLGVAFAIFLGKHLFGGIGQNVFNPAMLARTMLLIAFPLEMTTWIAPNLHAISFHEGLAITFLGQLPLSLDAISTATPLGHLKTELTMGASATHISDHFSFTDPVLGSINGSLGETSVILILLAGIYLIWRKIITWHIPVTIILTIWLLGTLFHWIEPIQHPPGTFHIIHGSILFVAIFIATDPVTAPVTFKGQLIFGIGVGLLTFIIRTWGSFPEGAGFAILLMNALTPLIDHYIRPRIYGRNNQGKPLKKE